MGSPQNTQPDVQAASRQSGRPRDWSFFFFFRILTRAEMAATQARVAAASTSEEAWRILKLDLAQPGLATAGLVAQYVADRDVKAAAGRPDDGATPLDHPSQEFLNWLDVLVNKRRESFLSGLADLTGLEGRSFSASPPQPFEAATLLAAMREGPEAMFRAVVRDVVAPTAALVSFLNASPTTYLEFMQLLAAELENPAVVDPGPLPLAILHEILRQGAPAFTQGPAENGDPSRDRPPVNLAFTHAGLAALKIDPATLASFPEVFKQGMAARARRLHDTGPSAPENWDGELGVDNVHGYVSGGFDGLGPTSEAFWRALRRDVQAFNDKASERGELLHLWIGLLFRFLGLEVVHIELGQEPYELVGGQQEGAERSKQVKRLVHRTEHFGFRDGLSQPFANLRLEEPPPGGGTPTADGWKPVAAGEIFLDRPDEDGEAHRFPLSEALRAGSTYLVFRKLEQDVHGFRAFLAQQRPSSIPARGLLAAQMVGRWPDGTPLVNQPAASTGPPAEATINDFLYFATDKSGEKCPLGAHIRRVNPRDTGGRDEVRHHRLHRRGISYGGSLLPEGAEDDGEKRGLLFIAANARIDVQFEVVQADWINGGEFLGQAGLGRCPMTGANNGTASDAFLEAGAPAPVTGLPRFVVTRGGDYFFAPGVKVLRAMVDPGEHFKAEPSTLTQYAFSMAQSATPSLMSKERLTRFAGQLLMGAPPIRAALPPQSDGSIQTVVFVGRHSDVSQVLGSVVNETGDNVVFSTRPYHEAGRQIVGDKIEILSATDVAGPTSNARERLKTVLDLGWATLEEALPETIDVILRREAQVGLEEALRTALRDAKSGRGRIDLVSDFAVQAAYGTVVRLYGVPGPSELPPTPPGPSYWQEHQADVPRQWIEAVQGLRDPGLTAMQAWSVILAASLVSNFQNQALLAKGAEYAASCMRKQISTQLITARAANLTKPSNLVEAFVLNRARPEIVELYPQETADEDYYSDVSALLLELVSTTLAAPPTAFGSLMTTVLKFRIDLAALLPELKPGGLARLIYEAERLNPVLALRMRQCEADTTLQRDEAEHPAELHKGDFLLAMVSAANLDPRRFEQPHRLSLTPFGPTDGPERRLEDYLMFGVHGDARQCWGRNRVAMPLLEECVQAASRLRGLRRVAGPDGDLKTLANVAIGLTARFTQIAPAPRPNPA